MLRPLLACIALAAGTAAQDGLTTPLLSPPSRTTQTIGLTEVTVEYNAPSVRGREVFGAKVPYDVVWRAGANATTRISFGTDVTVEGEPLAAGTYGLHAIPGRDEWVVIFNFVSQAWGSYGYDEVSDALRVTVTPRRAPHRERLAYLFEDMTDDAGTLVLHWETTAVPVRIAVDVIDTVLGPVREAAAGDRSASWRFWFEAAEFARTHGVDHAETMDWIDRSVAAQRTFSNLWTRSELLAEAGRRDDAERTREEALSLVNTDELSDLGYRYVLREDFQQAVTIFEMVVEMNPSTWWPYTQLAAARERIGDAAGAAEALRGALGKNPDPVTRSEIEARLKMLES